MQRAGRKRVLICAFACHPEGTSGLGSGEDLLGWRIVCQAARFHHVHVLTHAGNRQAIEAAQQAGAAAEASFHYVRLPRPLEWCVRHHRGPIQLYAYAWQARAAAEALRLHRRHRFDLFHHATYANDWMASHTGALLPVPYVRGPGGGAHRMPRELMRDYPLPDRLWEWLRSKGQWLYRHDPFFVAGGARAKAILVCNREALAALPRPWRAKAELFPVNGVPEEDFRVIQHARGRLSQNGAFRVLSAGSLLPLKRFDLAIRAFARFAKECPEAVLDVAGAGPELGSLKRLAARTGAGDRIRFLGHVPHRRLLERMAASDVFLFTSTRDGGAEVVVEAMAAGRPVVCIDVGGPGAHVQPGWGVKVPPAGPDAVVDSLTRALARLRRDAQLRRAMGARAAERAATHYHWDRLGERLARIYERAVNGATDTRRGKAGTMPAAV